MLIARSLTLKIAATVVASAIFVYLYDVAIPDSKFSVLPLGFEVAGDPTVPPTPGSHLVFSATAYCKGFVTSSGVAVQSGVVAADPVPAGRLSGRHKTTRSAPA